MDQSRRPMEWNFHSPLSGDQLAALRTLMAADRTLMAWLRTSLSLLSFGFTIYKVLEAVQAAGRVMAPGTARDAGLLMVTAGTLVMLLGIADYWKTLKLVGLQGAFKANRFSLFMAAVMAGAGMLLILAIAVRAV